MSTILRTGQVVQINLTAKYDLQRCINTFHYAISSPVSPVAPKSVTDLLGQWEIDVWGIALNQKLNAMYHANAVDFTITGQVIVGQGSRSVLEVRVPLRQTGGYDVGAALPSGTSAVLKRIGGLAGRMFRGRIYTFALPADYVSGSSLDPAKMAVFEGAAATLNLPIKIGIGADAYTASPVLISGLNPPTSGQYIESAEVNSEVRYQRRREVGSGV